MKLESLAPLLIGTLALACGGGKDAANGNATMADRSEPTAVSACSLLTVEEIAEVTGANVATIKPDTFGTVATCNYQSGEQLVPIVSVVLAPGMPAVASSAELAAWRKEQTTSSAYGDFTFIIEPIEGLGAPAIRNEVEGVGLVAVETAAKGLLVDITTSSLEQSKALIPKALARLP